MKRTGVVAAVALCLTVFVGQGVHASFTGSASGSGAVQFGGLAFTTHSCASGNDGDRDDVNVSGADPTSGSASCDDAVSSSTDPTASPSGFSGQVAVPVEQLLSGSQADGRVVIALTNTGSVPLRRLLLSLGPANAERLKELSVDVTVDGSTVVNDEGLLQLEQAPLELLGTGTAVGPGSSVKVAISFPTPGDADGHALGATGPAFFLTASDA